ncbi:MAG: stage 0 sporulation protein [Nitrospirae bacterium]|nr:stage 0 sporulation protein [Nitrospirota bacterium]
MPDVVGVRFKRSCTIYDFEINGADTEYKAGDLVVVDSELGLGIGSVVTESRTVEKPAGELKKVLRKATDEDRKQKQENEGFEKEARDYCFERINARGLPMKLISTETTLNKKRIIFYFSAEGRIDFRELVKDLAAKFKTRIEMRQIGVRDEAKIVGGFGMCGREFCCNTFLVSFAPISIKMAKQQDLVLNMNKLSGVCGRLMCCLGYESLEETQEETSRIVSDKDSADKDSNVIDGGAEAEISNQVSQEVAVPEPELSETRQLKSEDLETKQIEPPISVSPPDTVPSGASQKEEPNEQKSGQRSKKRKKWRWRKFYKK